MPDVEPLRQLAYCHAVPHGDWRTANETGVMQVKERPFYELAAERVGAVKHDHGNSRAQHTPPGTPS